MLARIALVLGLLLIWLVALMPLKAVALAAGGSSALGYRDVFGTIWQGRVYGLSLNGVPVREVEVSLDPLALVTGQLGGRWRITDTALRGDGVARLSSRTLGLSSTDLVVTLDRLGLDDLPGLDPSERVFVRLDTLRLRDGACEVAAGTVQTGALITLARLYGQDGPTLTGTLDCAGGQVVLDWSGQSEGLTVSGQVLFAASGYDWTVEVTTDWPDLADALALAGLEREGQVWRAEGSEGYDTLG